MSQKHFSLIRQYTKKRNINYDAAKKVYVKGSKQEQAKWRYEMQVFLGDKKSSYLE